MSRQSPHIDWSLFSPRFRSIGADLAVQAAQNGFGGALSLTASSRIRVPSGIYLPPGNAGVVAWTLCTCANGRLFAVPGTLTCADATDPLRCA